MSLLEDIYNAGIVGAGGAGFPTHIKYNTKAEHLIINAAECEPLLYTDQYQMINNAKEIIAGTLMGQEYLEAKKVTIAIKAEFHESIKALEGEIERQNANITIHGMETFYPAGDEHSVIYEVTKEALDPGRIPIEIGIVVSNVATMRNIYDSTKGEPVIRKVVTVGGHVNKQTILDVPVGISIDECLQQSGGTDLEDYYIVFGGPMMGELISKEESKTRSVTKTSGGILVFPSDHSIITRKLQSLERIRNQTSSACIQCTFCTELCPRYLKGHPLRPHEVMVAFGQGDPDHPKLKQSDLCCECGICELYSCPMGLSPRIVLAHVKEENRKRGGERVQWESEGVRDVESMRKLPTKRLNMKLNIDRYAKNKEFDEKYLKTNRVSIPLSQHIGRPAEPKVSVGDFVQVGDLIGSVPMDEMGANIHASISGKVICVTDVVVIEGGIQ